MKNAPPQTYEALCAAYKVDTACPLVERDVPRVHALLEKIESHDTLSDEEIQFADGVGLNYALYKYFIIRALFYGPGWRYLHMIPMACSQARKAGLPEKAISLADRYIASKKTNLRTKAALYTSRGGALRDLLRYEEAIESANAAIRMRPSSHHPHRLLGAIYYARGMFDAGANELARAVEKGASPANVERLLRHEITAADDPLRAEMVLFLLQLDPVKYDWVRQYAPPTAP